MRHPGPGLPRRYQVGMAAWEAEGMALAQSWRYLPPIIMDVYVRSYYGAKLRLALELADSSHLARVLAELLELAQEEQS